MLEFCLVVLPWMANPVVLVEPAGLAPSTTTCLRPAASIVELPQHQATVVVRPSTTDTVEHWLTRWERAARQIPEQNRSQREEFRRLIRERFSAHVVDAVDSLTGRIESEELLKRFRWQISETTTETICLEAIPRDDIDRLFVGSLRIQFDHDTSIPTELTVVGRDQRRHTVWHLAREETRDVEWVRFQESVPPALDVLFRTADSRAE